MISFDGSKSLSMWKKTLELGKKYDSQFTYFVSGVYFIADKNKDIYKAPRKRVGRSYIGFGGTGEQILWRHDLVKKAIRHGHEISSHANGHFSGGLEEWKGNVVGEDWTDDMWYSELDNFLQFLWNVSKINDLNTSSSAVREWQRLLSTQIHGFRAPSLNTNRGLGLAMAQTYKAGHFTQKYIYDSSIAKNVNVVKKTVDGLWEMPLGLIKIHGTNRSTIAMDFNFYNFDSNSKHDPNPDNAKIYEERYYKSLIGYFHRSDRGNKAPLFIGNHFSTWNYGAYTKGLFRFVKDICPLPHVKCITMKDYADLLPLAAASPPKPPAGDKKQQTEDKQANDDVTLPEGGTPIDLGDLFKGCEDSKDIICPESEDISGRFQSIEDLEDESYNLPCTPEAHNELVDESLLNFKL